MKLPMDEIKKHVLSLVIFLAIVGGYFAPSLFENKEIPQGDMTKYKGMVEEIDRYAQTDAAAEQDVVAWTGSMFSGMPTYHIKVPGTPKNFLTWLEKPFKKIDYFGASMVLVGLICFYILLLVLGVNHWLAVAGAIAYALASYNIIIIVAGHITKAYVIAYMPLVPAGMLLLFRKKWLMGAALTTLGIALSIMNKHIQITYYLAIFCFVIYLCYLWMAGREKRWKEAGVVSAVLLGCVLLAVVPNLGSLYADLEMSRESLRGPTELTAVTTGDASAVSTGLDIDYAYMWSYGKAETMTLLIPNFYGGSSAESLGESSHFYQLLRQAGYQTGNTVQAPTYWGDQPFTSGPVYFGALICFLFVLGMFAVRHPAKWWMLGAALFFVFLSWGRNLMGLNELLFHYLPLYNKFRTPSMALVIPGLIFPLIGIWGLKEILEGKYTGEPLKKAFYWSLGLTGGLCLVFWLVPGMFLDFSSVQDRAQGMDEVVLRAVIQDREALVRSDASRSLVFILLGGGLLFYFMRAKETVKAGQYVSIGMALLILVDLWGVDKRYLNNDTFVAPRSNNPFVLKAADQEMLKDKSPSYRVFSLENPFNETYTSFHHKSIGGYSAAKLRRYQELIDYRINKEYRMIEGALRECKTLADFDEKRVFEQTPTLNMLNARYVVYNKEAYPIRNHHAYGNAWFVREARTVENADAEMAALQSIDPRYTAVVDRRFSSQLEGFTPDVDSTASIALLSYEPVKLVYRTSAQSEQLAVFSEIYYPYGWQAFIDGQPVEHFRADWILRGLRIPAGEHRVEFVFTPTRYIAASRVASGGSLVVLLFFLFAVGAGCRAKRPPERPDDQYGRQCQPPAA